MLRKAALALAAMFLAQPSAALAEQDTNGRQTIRIELTEQMQEAESTYLQMQENLTQEQKDYLVHLDKTLIRALNPDAKVMQTEAYMKVCINSDADISSEPEKYSKALENWRSDVKANQDKVWEEQRKLYSKVDFIDPTILRNHLHVEKTMILAVFDTMVQRNIETGSYDCGSIKETLSGYL